MVPHFACFLCGKDRMLHLPSHVHMLDTTYEPQAKQCVTSGCTRKTWNGKPGEVCCRNCPHPKGGTHDSQCEMQADFAKLWGDRFEGLKECMRWICSYPRLSKCAPINPCFVFVFLFLLKALDTPLRYSLRQHSDGHSRYHFRGRRNRTCVACILNDIARCPRQ